MTKGSNRCALRNNNVAYKSGICWSGGSANIWRMYANRYQGKLDLIDFREKQLTDEPMPMAHLALLPSLEDLEYRRVRDSNYVALYDCTPSFAFFLLIFTDTTVLFS